MQEKISLLLDLEERDYNSVIDELSLQKKGFKFHYVIDMFDINEYCYPFGLKEKSHPSVKHIDYVADEQYSLYQLFYSKDEKIFLLDEYLIELLYFKRFIQYATKQQLALVDTLKKYEEEFYTVGKLNDRSEREFKELVSSKLSLILSYLVDYNNSGIQKLVKLFQEKRLILNEDDFDYSKEQVELKNLFASNKGGDLTGEIFSKIWKEESEYDNSKLDTNVRYVARQRDARVIDRLFTINENLAKNKLNNNRQFILYLSSTDTSKEIFQDDFLIRRFPQIDGISLNLLRNKSQIFLKKLCYNPKNIDESIENVEYLRDRILSIKRFQNLIPREYLQSDINSYLLSKFDYYREKFENYAILNQYQNISTLINTTITKIKNNPQNDRFSTQLLPLLDEIIELGKNNKVKKLDDLITLDNWENQIKLNYYFNYIIDLSKKQNETIRFNTGVDIIRGTTQHLPIIYSLEEQNFKTIINSFAEYIINPQHSIDADQLRKLAEENYSRSMQLKPSLEERLVKAFILLLIPENEGFENTNELAYEWTYSILQKEILEYKEADNISLIERDYRYFIGWAARRCGRYEDSKKILKESLTKFNNDPRFYHGLCLTLYCISDKDSKLNSKQRISSLKECIDYALKAIQLYEQGVKTIIIDKTKNALFNSLSYLYADIYFLENSFGENESLLEARIWLNTLKREESSYQDYPEYLHTEAYLELQEFKFIDFKLANESNSNLKKVDAHYKISCALIAIVSAIDISARKRVSKSAQKYKELYNEIRTFKNDFEKKYPIDEL